MLTESDSGVLKAQRDLLKDTVGTGAELKPKKSTSVTLDGLSPSETKPFFIAAEKLQSKKTVKPLHGSAALSSYLSETKQAAIGRVGDLDLPFKKSRFGIFGKNEKKLDNAIMEVAGKIKSDLPDSQISVGGVGKPFGVNRSISVNGKKKFEIVTEEFSGPSKDTSHIMGYRVSEKSNKAIINDVGIDVTKSSNQVLENISTTTAITPAKKGVRVIPPEGRLKDRVRAIEGLSQYGDELGISKSTKFKSDIDLLKSAWNLNRRVDKPEIIKIVTKKTPSLIPSSKSAASKITFIVIDSSCKVIQYHIILFIKIKIFKVIIRIRIKSTRRIFCNFIKTKVIFKAIRVKVIP